MLKRDAEATFRREILPSLREEESESIIDKPARRFAWSCFKEGLHRDGQITNTQSASWTLPRWLYSRCHC